jgi:Ca2+-binding RTX toxin-like protein
MAFINIPQNSTSFQVQGTEQNDVINDTANDNRRILGLGGDDLIRGYGGNDELYGNPGEDSVNGGLGNDSIYGGRDNDGLGGEEGDDLLFGNLGADVLTGSMGNDQLFGGRDNDYLSGGTGGDFLSGDLGFDILDGGFGNDTLLLRDESATNSFDYLENFIPGEDKIALGGGLSFRDLDILTFRATGLDRTTVRSQFSPWTSNIDLFPEDFLVLRVRSSNRILGLLNNRPSNNLSTGITLRQNSLSAADFISV